ncbi:SocA family protein [Candidatus Acetothermia bacterium]|nr:SocA family protein [Candidatus Acetothermia bacterium]MBI3644179.1 SocA family protein [Candidatus Acetothermia bacterium]
MIKQNKLETEQQSGDVKLEELIVFFAQECIGDKHFGATKLNKLLFTADFWAHAYLGRSITGTKYIRQQFGPTPDPDLFLKIRQSLIDDGRITIVGEETYRGIRQRPIALTEPNLQIFDKNEIALCRDIIEFLRPLYGVESSEWSHEFPGWQYTNEGDTIPYESVFLWRKEPVTQEDKEWAKSIGQQLGLI